MTKHWCMYLTDDTLQDVLSWLSEEELADFENSENLFLNEAPRSLHKIRLESAICQRWIHFFETDLQRNIPRWSLWVSSLENLRREGRRYVRQCREGRKRAAEARTMYDFATDQPSPRFRQDVLCHEIPFREPQDEFESEQYSLSPKHWSRWKAPSSNSQETVFVTITKLDCGWTWQGFRTLRNVVSNDSLHLGEIKIGCWRSFASESNWCYLAVLASRLEDARRFPNHEILNDPVPQEYFLRHILRNMQVTITSPTDDRVMYATGGFKGLEHSSRNEVSGVFHYRHIQNPWEKIVPGPFAWRMKLDIVSACIVLSLERLG
ncbi:hypothetical protein IV203_028956 [Nitzschia inconspicua]|uniref:Uncharacterized protein n=1 Tax=Nitzschia inconspicua TaxID=303405 RepID=A0A9K3LTG1_9STRA|nr:hypothetical protein IV203_028956 [Nitzschia inconspicua]